MKNLLKNYGWELNDEDVDHSLVSIASSLDELRSKEAFIKCFSVMDLTSLHSSDTEASVRKLVCKVNELGYMYPGYPLPASICVFPNFAGVVAAERASDELHVTTVSACFPSSQSFLEVKVRECEMAVEAGADEIDIVLALNAFLAGDYDRASQEIRAVRVAVDSVGRRLRKTIVLKVILETGLLVSLENIVAASFLAMEAGADFIKTSTGKVDVNATPSAAYVMCSAIKSYSEASGRKVGFKAAGGISSAMDALSYYAIVLSVLGPEWLDKSLFRLGVSRLGNALMSSIEGETVNYF